MSTDRRQFIAGLFAILPAATCYKRVWKEITKQPEWIVSGSIKYRIDAINLWDGEPLQLAWNLFSKAGAYPTGHGQVLWQLTESEIKKCIEA